MMVCPQLKRAYPALQSSPITPPLLFLRCLISEGLTLRVANSSIAAMIKFLRLTFLWPREDASILAKLDASVGKRIHHGANAQ